MRVFLSHSSKDNELAERIYKWLYNQGISVWFDKIELRAGDSLLEKIEKGIDGSNILLVLITENSKDSLWVQKEINIALTKEINGSGPKVIPLLVKDCNIPSILADKLYITFNEKQTEFNEIVPAIFRDSYIINIELNNKLELDIRKVTQELDNYRQSNFDNVKMIIHASDFNNKILELADKTLNWLNNQQHNNDIKPFLNIIKNTINVLPSILPLHWRNLTELLSKLATSNVDLRTLCESIKNVWNLSRFILIRYLYKFIFPAERFGYTEFSSLVKFCLDYYEWYTPAIYEKLIVDLFQLEDKSLTSIDLIGKEGVRDMTNIYIPLMAKDDKVYLQWGGFPAEYIPMYIWYICCIPQIITKTLWRVTFNEIKPLYKSNHKVGLEMLDYKWIGLH